MRKIFFTLVLLIPFCLFADEVEPFKCNFQLINLGKPTQLQFFMKDANNNIKKIFIPTSGLSNTFTIQDTKYLNIYGTTELTKGQDPSTISVSSYIRHTFENENKDHNVVLFIFGDITNKKTNVFAIDIDKYGDVANMGIIFNLTGKPLYLNSDVDKNKFIKPGTITPINIALDKNNCMQTEIFSSNDGQKEVLYDNKLYLRGSGMYSFIFLRNHPIKKDDIKIRVISKEMVTGSIDAQIEANKAKALDYSIDDIMYKNMLKEEAMVEKLRLERIKNKKK